MVRPSSFGMRPLKPLICLYISTISRALPVCLMNSQIPRCPIWVVKAMIRLSEHPGWTECSTMNVRVHLFSWPDCNELFNSLKCHLQRKEENLIVVQQKHLSCDVQKVGLICVLTVKAWPWTEPLLFAHTTKRPKMKPWTENLNKSWLTMSIWASLKIIHNKTLFMWTCSTQVCWHGMVKCTIRHGQHRLTSKTSLHGHTFSLELLLLAKNMINHRVCHCE